VGINELWSLNLRRAEGRAKLAVLGRKSYVILVSKFFAKGSTHDRSPDTGRCAEMSLARLSPRGGQACSSKVHISHAPSFVKHVDIKSSQAHIPWSTFVIFARRRKLRLGEGSRGFGTADLDALRNSVCAERAKSAKTCSSPEFLSVLAVPFPLSWTRGEPTVAWCDTPF
jgi:hypothetical protein